MKAGKVANDGEQLPVVSVKALPVPIVSYFGELCT